VHLATIADEPVSHETMQMLRNRCKNVTIERLGKTRWLSGAKSLLCGRSMTEGLFSSRRLRRTINQWATATRFDAAVVYCSSVFQYLSAEALSTVPAVVDLVDVDSQKWFDYASATRGLKRHVFRLEGRRTRRLEAEACRRASSIVLVSNAEADLFRSLSPNDRTCGVPNGVDLNYFRQLDQDGKPGRCVFIGALDYRPNVEGITWFCREVWPQVRSSHPMASIAIVGRNPTREVSRLGLLPGVEVYGTVPDVRPYLAEASLVVAPLAEFRTKSWRRWRPGGR
jgi:sugar transferase (PEP-CTERM/EpsH1 system associated)